MILLDYSQTIISTITADIGSRNNQHLDADLLRHMCINTIRAYNQKYRTQYGELVLACDSRNYWRKEAFPNYKSGRKKAREASQIDWTTIFDVMGEVREAMQEYFPYKTIYVDRAEADDVIGVLTDWAVENDVQESLFDTTPKPIMIISGDGDFVQLQKYNNVKQYSPIVRKMLVAKPSPEAVLLDHILTGDFGDGIPNVLSDDDCIRDGVRQRSMSKKKLAEWINNPSTMPTDEGFKRNFSRNKTLVDLSMIPDDVRTSIVNEYVGQPKKDRSKLINYFIKHKMKGMLDVVSDF